MPTYTVRAPNGRIYKVQGPTGATQAQVEAAVLETYPEAKQPERKIGRGEAFVRGAGQSFEKVGAFFAGAIGDLVDKFGVTPAQATAWAAENLSGKSPAEAQRIAQNLKSLPGFGEVVRAGGKALGRQDESAQRQRPVAFGAGRVAGDVAITAPLGGLAAKPLSMLASAAPRVAPVVAPLAQTIASAGLSTGVKTATPVLRAVDVALRIGGGGATGAATSAMLDQQIDEGTAVGAAVSMIPLVGRYGAGPVWDALRGRIGEARAARIFRQALGSNADAAREAFRKGGKGTASQILARVGIDADTFFATGELVAKSGAGTGVLDDIARGQEAAQKEVLNAAAGGAATRAGSRQAAATQRAVTTATAVPIMEESLGAANVNTQNVLAAQQQAAAARQAASTETNAARRLLSGAERQTGRLGEMNELNQMRQSEIDFGYRDNTLGTDFPPAAINRQGDVIAGLERFGGQAAERGLEAGAVARTAEQRLAELQAAGVQPLDASALAGRLRQMASVERANREKARVLSGFADQLESLAADNKGVIDASDLYELRKDAGGIVETLLQGRTPDAIRKRTAEVIGAVRPLIDDAIEAAGGARWREYLDTFSTGMDEARRVELSDFARKLYTDQPEQFQRLMGNDRPDILDRFFGKGRFDTIEQALGPKAVELQGPKRPGFSQPSTMPAGPSRLPALTGVAEDLGVDTQIKNLMTPGAKARAAEIMQPPTNVMAEFGRSVPFGFGGFIERPAILLEDKLLNPRAARALERGFASPQGAAGLLDYATAGQRGINFLNTLSPDTLQALQQFGVQIGREQPANRMRR